MKSTCYSAVLLALIALVSACNTFGPQRAGVGKAVSFDSLPGWQADHHSDAMAPLQKSCTRLIKQPKWSEVCNAAQALSDAQPKITDSQAKVFFEKYFTPHVLNGERGRKKGMITGYYEPLLQGSLSADERYRYPLYRAPDDMLIIELGEIYPDLKGKRVRGRLVGKKVIPYYARAEIDQRDSPLKGQELLWVDDLDQAFFLQIQGSGRVQLPDGSVVGAAYANQNGHAYVSIGKRLIEMGELKLEDVSLFTIRAWLKQNPERSQTLLNENPSYVFFTLKNDTSNGPNGSLNVPLTPERSLAIDPNFIELGSPIWINTTYPDAYNAPLQKLVMAQDTGGAIKGQLRADLFWGTGPRAEAMAGNMKQAGELYILKLNDVP